VERKIKAGIKLASIGFLTKGADDHGGESAVMNSKLRAGVITCAVFTFASNAHGEDAVARQKLRIERSLCYETRSLGISGDISVHRYGFGFRR
jgi:hypothetical protein